MYRLISTNGWHHGRRFDSLAAAKAYADKHAVESDCVIDVVRDIDRDHFQAVYGASKAHAPLIRGRYER